MLKERLLEIKEFADTTSISIEEIKEVLNEIYGDRKWVVVIFLDD